jgi:single-stranded-DNA-specific exonuclease
LVKFGGHEYAGGLSITADKLECFADAFEAVARQRLTMEDLRPLLEVDAALDFSQIGLGLLRELEVMKPFGVGNPEPVFMTADAQVCERKVFASGVRYRLRQADRVVGAVIFGVGEY